MRRPVTSVLRRFVMKPIDWFCSKIWPMVDAQPQFFNIQLDITNACNLRCDHCYLPHHRNDGGLGLAQWLQVLDQYESLVRTLRMVPRITLCGGEPLLASFLAELLTAIRARFGDCDLSVQTNGTILTEAMAHTFHELGVSLQISIDGPDAATHDRIRGAGSFEKTMAGCRLLRQCQVPFHFQAVLSDRTVPWIAEFFARARTESATAMHFARLIGEGHAKPLIVSGLDHPLSGHDLEQAMRAILHHAALTHIPTSTFGPLWHLLDEKIGTPDNTGFAGVVVDYQGGFKVTSRAPLVLGNVLTDGMETLFLEHPVMQRLRSNHIDGCGECPHFTRCRGNRNSSFAAHGHFFGPDPGCWIFPALQKAADNTKTAPKEAI